MRYRLDELLVRRRMVETRSQAQLLIKEGKVLTSSGVAQKPGQKLNETAKITVSITEKYVSRGGHKIKAAFENFKVKLKDKIIADVGASTGGFSDYVLQNGAKKVYAIDVGHGQLADKIKNDKRIINMEGINIKDLKSLPEKVDIAVVDLSYISLKLALENIFNLVRGYGRVICLFKPQFEAGKGIVPKDGVIKNERLRETILKNFLEWCMEKKYPRPKVMQSPVIGGDGNVEYLLHFQVNPDSIQ
ncbi:MAG: TlyA family RNA methyltransferase [Candidatus Gracilibacteria bacterium]|jgi:23S rRNA (cytidine1920-2'-O)/16S rRNA (cytidine1409-2'-O)-methyltransferase